MGKIESCLYKLKTELNTKLNYVDYDSLTESQMEILEGIVLRLYKAKSAADAIIESQDRKFH